MRITVSKKGQIELPASFRRQDGLRPGEEFDIERFGPGEYRLRRRMLPRNQGLVDLLLRCPEKGFFVAIELESTDAL